MAAVCFLPQISGRTTTASVKTTFRKVSEGGGKMIESGGEDPGFLPFRAGSEIEGDLHTVEGFEFLEKGLPKESPISTVPINLRSRKTGATLRMLNPVAPHSIPPTPFPVSKTLRMVGPVRGASRRRNGPGHGASKRKHRGGRGSETVGLRSC
jgi:hypothetical protein